MPKPPIDLPAVILAKLGAAGQKGLPGSKLPEAKKQRATTLARLESERKIGNLGSASKPCYVLMEYYNPLEIAAEHIESLATPGKATAFILARLKKGTAGVVSQHIQQAIGILTKEQKLLLLKIGQTSYWLHAASVRPLLLPENGPESPNTPLSSEALDLEAAYARAQEKEGFADVPLSLLLKESGLTVSGLHEELLLRARSGKAVLSLGDYSLSDEEERAAALPLDGRTYLRVRFLS